MGLLILYSRYLSVVSIIYYKLKFAPHYFAEYLIRHRIVFMWRLGAVGIIQLSFALKIHCKLKLPDTQ